MPKLTIRDEAGEVSQEITPEQRKAILDYVWPLATPLPDMVKAASDYLLAIDQWENTNKAERRVETAEAVLRAVVRKAGAA